MLKSKLIMFAVLSVFITEAFAEPSLSADSSKERKETESSKASVNINATADKKKGNRDTETRSRDKAGERARDRVSSDKATVEDRRSQDYTVERDLNSLLLQAFVNQYEKIDAHDLPQDAHQAQLYFATCKPFQKKIQDYPVINWRPAGGASCLPNCLRLEILKFGVNVAPLEVAMNVSADEVSSRYVIHDIKDAFLSREKSYGLNTRFSVDPEIPHVSRYSQCRITAHYWVARAAEAASSQPAYNEWEMKQRVEAIFNAMDRDHELFLTIRQQARDLWKDASCSNWLTYKGDFQGPAIECGIFTFRDNGFTVDYRPTLSQDSIDGKRYKILTSASHSASMSEEESRSASIRLSETIRVAVSHDDYRDRSKGGSVSIGTSSETSSDQSRTASDKASIGVTPKSAPQQ